MKHQEYDFYELPILSVPKVLVHSHLPALKNKIKIKVDEN